MSIDREQSETGLISPSTADRISGVLNVTLDFLEDMQKVVAVKRPRAVRIRFGDKTIAEVPIALTAAAALTAGLAAVLLTKLAVDVVSDEE
ncbi:hypothetical protein LLG46_06040 [bacterium]|nr:hypothetical protein [bacterium]